MAYTLKYDFNQDAVAFSFSKNGDELLKVLAGWADYIVLMEPKFAARFEAWKDKVRVVDVGSDRWGNPFHRELYDFVAKTAQDWSNRQFEI